MTSVVCLASGPSFDAEQAEVLRRHRARFHLFAVNRVWAEPYNFADADLLYAADERFWQVKEYGGRAFAEFRGEMWTCHEEAARRFGLCFQKVNDRPEGLPKTPVHPDAGIDSGNNSGHQMIGLAYKLLRLRDPADTGPIILVGYDMQHTGGRKHSHADYGKHAVNGREIVFSNAGDVANWVKYFNRLARELAAEGMKVLNCTAQTALTCFPRADLAWTLAHL